MEFTRSSEHVYRFEDTCNVYALVSGSEAVLIDVGSGDVLDALSDLGVTRVTDVLMTHHHRDQAQGLPRVAETGARIWVPAAERELFEDAERRWLARDVRNNYNTREDRFSLPRSVPIAGSLREYVPTRYGHVTVTTIPLPGHTVGSVGFLIEVDGRQHAFTGDLLAGPGKVWSLAATQWTYAGPEGLALSWLSLQDLRDRSPDVLMPSHGPVMEEPVGAIELTADRIQELLALRGQHRHLAERRAEPFTQVSPHLIHNHASHANSYVLLSETGKALVVDQGYDFEAGLPAGTDRAARRPWLYTLPLLKERFSVRSIDVALPTHYHDDHVAGLELLRDVEGTEIWGPENLVDIFRDPGRYDLPCLWHAPVPVDRVVPLATPLAWEEYELTLHELPGHTLYAVAIETEVDGMRVLFTGDQTDGDGRLNYVYQNRFRISDYRITGELYERIAPELLLTGHWGPMPVDAALLTELRARGEELERLHRELLPLDDVDLGAEGRAAWIRPYHSRVHAGATVRFEVEVRNPSATRERVEIALIPPPDWRVEPARAATELDAREHGTVVAELTVPADATELRSVVTADLRVGGRRFGQQAEALVDLV